GSGLRLRHLPPVQPSLPASPAADQRDARRPPEHDPQPALLPGSDAAGALFDPGRFVRALRAGRAGRPRVGRWRVGRRRTVPSAYRQLYLQVNLANSSGSRSFHMPLISDAFAQGATTSGDAGGMMPLVFIVVMFAIFYFLLIRPQAKRQKELKAMVEALGKGDEIVTTGGLVGRVTDLCDQ